MSERREHHSALAPFRLPLFRGLWTANVLSTIGGYINDVGAAWLMTSLSPSPLMVSLVQVASNAPFLLLALPGGALGDVLNKRKLLLVTQVAMMVLSALLGVLTLLGRISPVSLLLILFLVEVFDALAGPAWQTLIPEIVGGKGMRAAITLNSVGMNVARALGPALGGALVAVTVTSGPAFLMNAASFLGVLVFLWRWKRRTESSGLPAERLLGAMRVGVRYVRYAPRFRATLVRIGAFILFASALATLLPVIARVHLHRGPGAYGVLLGFMGAGAVAALPVLQHAQRMVKTDALLAIATAICACVLLALGAIHNYPVLCGVMAVAGVAWVTVMSSMNNAAQSVLPAWVRARAMSVYLMAFFGAMTGGGLLWGIIANRFGAPMAMTIAGCGLFATLALIPRFRLVEYERLDLAPSLHWAAPVVIHPVTDDRGPVLVTVEYRVDPQHTPQFVKAMQRLRFQRMQTGAFQWGLFNDTADPTRFVETFLSESWSEHLRQHGRVTVADREMEETISALHLGPEKPIVRHLIHSDLKSLEGPNFARKGDPR
jgi:MFS family permease